jgi:hypothetical protein
LRQGHLTALHHFYQPGAGHEIPEGTRHWARRSL